MGRPGKRPERLSELIQAAGIAQDDVPPKSCRPPCPFPGPREADKVRKALEGTLNEEASIKRTLNRLRPRSTMSFSYEKHLALRATRALHALFDDGCSPAEALILVNMGADVNKARRGSDTMSKNVQGTVQEDFRTDIFTRAVRSGNTVMVNVLVDGADQINLDDGLKIALAQRHCEILTILMQAGANPAVCEVELRRAVEAKAFEAVLILCGGLVPLTQKMGTEHLCQMVVDGQLSIVRSFLRDGADANVDKPSALECAVRRNDIKLVAALCQAQRAPSPDHLARGVSILLEVPTTSPSENAILEVLLAAGAQGPQVDEAIVVAAKQRDLRLLKLLLEYSRFNFIWTPEAIIATIDNGDLASFGLLLAIVDPRSELDRCVDRLLTSGIRSSVPLTTRTNMIEAIVRTNIKKKTLSNALMVATTDNEINIVRSLMEAGVRHGYELVCGELIGIAIHRRSVTLLSHLLHGRPSVTVMDTALKNFNDIDSSIELEMVKALLDAGATTGSLGPMFRQLIERHDKTEFHYQMIRSFLGAGVQVDASANGCLLLAVRAADLRAVDMLLEKLASGSNLEVAVSASNGIKNLDERYRVIESLLKSGARGICITRALIDVLERFPREKRFSRLLVSKGAPDIDFMEGKVVTQAVMHKDTELLHILMKHKPTPETLNKALKKATVLEEGPTRLQICRALLLAGAKGDEVSTALIRVAIAEPCDLELARLLVLFKASIDFKSGLALKIALERMDLDLLHILLRSTAQQDTIVRSLNQALKLAQQNDRSSVVSLLLNSPTKLSPEILGRLLPNTLGEAMDQRTLSLFLDKKASVNTGSIEIFEKVILSNQCSILNTLLNAGANETTVRSAFAYAWRVKEKIGFDALIAISADPSRRKFLDIVEYLDEAIVQVTCSVHLVTILLEFLEPSARPPVNRYIQIAIQRGNVLLLKLLVNFFRTSLAKIKYFAEAMKCEEIWDEPSGPDCVLVLLEGNPPEVQLNESLISATSNYRKWQNSPVILQYLIDSGANTAYQSGKVFAMAALDRNADLVHRLLITQLSKLTLHNSFPYILFLKADTTILVRSIDSFVQGLALKRDRRTPYHNELDPALFLALLRAPGKSETVLSLLLAGASASRAMRDLLVQEIGQESPLLFLNRVRDALPKDGLAIIKLLLSHGADPNFIAPVSGLTPILAAARLNHARIAEELVEHGANVSVRDKDGRTPLFYTTQSNDISTMHILLQAHAPVNDGSLHEAIRVGFWEAVPELLKAGHDPNFQCFHYDGRGALEVFIMDTRLFKSHKDTYMMLQSLVDHGANTKLRKDGKSLLVMALDQKNASAIVLPLLIAFANSTVNDRLNLYHEDGFVYSPTSYLVHGKQKTAGMSNDELLKQLRDRGCNDVYYHETGPQPKEYVGAPAHIQEDEDRRNSNLKG